jgi:hypothetical protein
MTEEYAVVIVSGSSAVPSSNNGNSQGKVARVHEGIGGDNG